jgi:hypothetical protein
MLGIASGAAAGMRGAGEAGVAGRAGGAAGAGCAEAKPAPDTALQTRAAQAARCKVVKSVIVVVL